MGTDVLCSRCKYIFSGYTVCIPYFSADKVGSYVAELKVTDSFDASSENFAATVIEVVPYEDLFITLSWDTPNIDLDLHLLSNPMGYYGNEDCFLEILHLTGENSIITQMIQYWFLMMKGMSR